MGVRTHSNLPRTFLVSLGLQIDHDLDVPSTARRPEHRVLFVSEIQGHSAEQTTPLRLSFGLCRFSRTLVGFLTVGP